MWSLLLIALAEAGGECTRYSCHGEGIDYGNVCVNKNITQNTVLMQVCQTTTDPHCIVGPEITQNSTCGPEPRPVMEPKLPGENCVKDSGCLSGNCASGKCQGQPLGEFCTSHGDCNVGNYCAQDGKCKTQKGQGQACRSDFECVNTMACNRTYYDEGTCVSYYSLENGQTVGMCLTWNGQGVTNLCKSGGCEETIFDENGTGKCIEEIINPNYGKPCEKDNDCIGTGNKTLVSGSCKCGMDKEGYKYCDTFTGDPPSKIKRSLLLKHVNSPAIKSCQTLGRFDEYCLEKTLSSVERFQLARNDLLAEDYGRYQGNDDCTKVIYNQKYFGLSENDFECKAYSCGGSDWKDGVCIAYNEGDNTFYSKGCPNNSHDSYCDSELAASDKFLNVTCGQAPEPSPKYPGESCSNDTQCISGNCANGVCKGKPKAGTCSHNKDCDPGLYCSFNDNCTELIPAGSSGCISDFECALGAFCNTTSGQIGNHPCVPYFSGKIGDPVPPPQSSISIGSGFSYACESATYNSTSGTCVSAPKSSSFPIECTNSEKDCKVDSSFQGTCSCGMNPYAKKYCSPMTGDPPGALLIDELKKIDHTNNTFCNTERRYSVECLMKAAGEQKLNPDFVYLRIYNFTNFARYHENDNCTKKAFNKDFWDRVYIPGNWGKETLKNATLEWQIRSSQVIFNLTVDRVIVENHGWYGVALKELSYPVTMQDGEYAVLMLKNHSLFHMNTFNLTTKGGRPMNNTIPTFYGSIVKKTSNGGIMASWTRELETLIDGQTINLVPSARYTLLYAFGKIDSNGTMQPHESTDRGYGNITLYNTFSGNAYIPPNPHHDDSAFGLCNLLSLLLFQVLL